MAMVWSELSIDLGTRDFLSPDTLSAPLEESNPDIAPWLAAQDEPVSFPRYRYPRSRLCLLGCIAYTSPKKPEDERLAKGLVLQFHDSRQRPQFLVAAHPGVQIDTQQRIP